jgi:GTPase SAR1 family protein
MRFFGSKEGDPLEQCLSKLRQCNYYMGIIGHRYGSIHEELNLSYTELEYQEAKKLGIKRRIYLAASTVAIQPNQVESDATRKKLDAFKQQLKKDNTLVPFNSPDDLATKVLSDIFLTQYSKTEIDSFAKTKYLPAIRRTSALISFLGLDIQNMKRHKDVKLQSVYIEPRFGTRRDKSDPGAMPATVPAESAIAADPLTSSVSLSAREILLRGEKIVILGDPGAGKSTLTKSLIVGFIDGDLRIGDRTDIIIPIKIPLKAYAESRSRPEGLGLTILDFVRATTKTELQGDDLPDDFFEVFLAQEAAVVIFDGLDEIFDPHTRGQVRNDIDSFAFWSYPGNKIIITSRKVGYEEVSFQQPDFAHFEILPFDSNQISEYVRKWYALEEPDKTRREKEVRDLTSALEKLPQELLGNPLLLSLIVILFRSGCTLPDSKLEIYRSCVGTLTEKWDAAGKRLEVPAEYSAVRDKKSAFAHIGYWMYRRQTQESEKPSRPKYMDVRTEVTRYLCEREFQDREGEAEGAAESFLEYAAKRSIFIEDRFSHKTFHEYFAALFLYRNFCVGKTVDDLYSEISSYLANDAWSVVLELLFLMIDEQGVVLLDSLLNKIIHEVRTSQQHSQAEILVPLRVLGQLQNIGSKTLNSLCEVAAEALLSSRIEPLWGKGIVPEAIHRKIFAAIEVIPSRYHPLLIGSLQKAAASSKSEDALALLVALLYESSSDLPRPAEVIPSWDKEGSRLACRHLSTFYAFWFSESISTRVSQFVQCFGTSKLFEGCKKIFSPRVTYRPFAEYSLLCVGIARDVESVDSSIVDFLTSPELEELLRGLIKRSSDSETGFHHDVDVIMEHFSKTWDDPRKYLVDYLLLVRFWVFVETEPARARKLTRFLRTHSKKSSGARQFYANLLLGLPLPNVSLKRLGISVELFEELSQVADRTRKNRQGTQAKKG